MDIFVILVILIILGGALFIFVRIIKMLSSGSIKVLPSESGVKEEPMPFARKRYFFNTSEQQFFSILEQQLDHSRFSVFPKVRLGDFVETTNGGTERWGSWNRIKSRHIDFLIFDTQKSSIAVAIELDGASHRSAKAQESDHFKDELCKAIGLPLVRVKVGTNFASEISQILQNLSN